MAFVLRGLCVIVDKGVLGERGPAIVVRQLLGAGVRWLQYRDKHSTDEEVAAAAAGIAPLCGDAGATLVINDRVPVLLTGYGDGVHLGRGDMPVGEARRLLGPGKIIGFSAHDVAEARRAEEEGADYLGVGAVYPTPTKRDADVVGVGRIREICRSTRLPVLAIGGIARENVREVLGAGATGVAVISAVIGASDPAAAARDLLKEIGDFEMGQDLPRRTRRSRN